MADQRIPCAILGATGNVGQRFIQLLDRHPWFRPAELVASERSAGRPYAEAADWRVEAEMPESVRDLTVRGYDAALESSVVFSALPGEVAGEIEQRMARDGHAVLTNTSTHRMEPDVPLMIAEVNPDHAAAIAYQQARREWSGFIVANANCSAIHLTLALKPIQAAFGIEAVMVTTLQAVSGAGYPGVPSMDMIDNVVPYIGNEEEKLETEPRKMLGQFRDGQFVDADFILSTTCTRVPVRDGHTESVNLRLRIEATPEDVIDAMERFQAAPQLMELPSAPRRPIVVRRESNRPQPVLDRETERGMASVVGRVRVCPLMGIKFVVLGHNTLRGAAGASVLNAELLKAQDMLPV